jgi:hypothetical protein
MTFELLKECNIFKREGFKGWITAVKTMESSTTAHSVTGYDVQSRNNIYSNINMNLNYV